MKFEELNHFRKFFIFGFKAIMLGLMALSVYRIAEFSGNELPLKIALSIGVVAIFLVFDYLSVFDIVHFEVPSKIVIALPIVLLLINIVIGLVVGFNTTITLWNGNSITIMNNLAGGIIGAMVIGIIVFLTKEKGMGEGDIWVIAALGFFIGIDKLIIGFYLSIFSALLIGVLYAIRIRKFKGVPIPFVPFLVFGCLAAFALGLDYRVLFFS